jgi:hypothetical protein
VKVVSRTGTSAALDILRSGKGLDADLAYPPGEWIGWALFDQVARGILGEPSANVIAPQRLIDSTNIGSSAADLFPDYTSDAIAEVYKKAWAAS